MDNVPLILQVQKRRDPDSESALQSHDCHVVNGPSRGNRLSVCLHGAPLSWY